MKIYKIFFSVAFICNLSVNLAQGNFSVQIDGVIYPFKKVVAGAEKVMDKHIAAITFSDDQKSFTVDFDYKKLEGKSALMVSSELDSKT